MLCLQVGPRRQANLPAQEGRLRNSPSAAASAGASTSLASSGASVERPPIRLASELKARSAFLPSSSKLAAGAATGAGDDGVGSEGAAAAGASASFAAASDGAEMIQPSSFLAGEAAGEDGGESDRSGMVCLVRAMLKEGKGEREGRRRSMSRGRAPTPTAAAGDRVAGGLLLSPPTHHSDTDIEAQADSLVFLADSVLLLPDSSQM